MNHGEKAVELFTEGYNCAQAVLLAFSDMTGLDQSFAAKMISSFGGGVGRLREVCGAAAGHSGIARGLCGCLCAARSGVCHRADGGDTRRLRFPA